MSEAPKILLPAEHRRQPLAPAGEVTSIFQVLERAARDPNVDVDKMERLMAMAERAHERTAKAAYLSALADMQPELPVITERGQIKHGENKPVQSTYAKWEDINDAIKPILHAHGFSLSFRTGHEGATVVVTAVLGHREGHSETTALTLPIDASGSKNAVQGVGSSTSYGKRYTAAALLNITTRGEDDDGKAGARDQSGAMGKATEAVNSCNTVADLKRWKAEQWPGVSKMLSANEADQIIRLVNTRTRKMQNPDD